MSSDRLEPKLLTVLREGYTRQQFVGDLTAGVIVGIVALPLAIAFAIASGVTPEQGLYTAIIAGFLISALSGSRVQIGGPTGAFVVIVYDVVQRYGYDGLAVATLMAGALLVVMGLARLGQVIQFIPYPVTVGFTTGIALIIAAGQGRDALGLQMASVPAGFLEKMGAYGAHLGTVNVWAVTLCIATIGIVQLWPRVTLKVPGSLVALVATTALVHLAHLPVETIGSRFGSVSAALPTLRLPQVEWAALPTLVQPAVSIALLGGIESLLSAVVADGMTGRRHRSNMELIGQGVANLVTPLFGGIPATGAIARTATNIKNGAQTPVAGLIHAVVLLLILLVAARWAALIPMATLAGILLVVAYNMSEWRHFARLFRAPRSDLIVLLTTFGLTVLVDLTAAIQVGVLLAALLFMKRMADVTQTSNVTRSLAAAEDEADDPLSIRTRTVPPGVEVYEITGSFFFGAADTFKHALRTIERTPKVLILRMRHVYAMDATGLHALEDVLRQTQREGTTLVLSGVHAQPLVVMQRSGFLDEVGEANVFGNIDEALARAAALVG